MFQTSQLLGGFAIYVRRATGPGLVVVARVRAQGREQIGHFECKGDAIVVELLGCEQASFCGEFLSACHKNILTHHVCTYLRQKFPSLRRFLVRTTNLTIDELINYFNLIRSSTVFIT